MAIKRNISYSAKRTMNGEIETLVDHVTLPEMAKFAKTRGYAGKSSYEAVATYLGREHILVIKHGV